MILGSIILFLFSFPLLVLFPPAAFVTWLVSFVMLIIGLSRRSKRKAVQRAIRRKSLVLRDCPHCKEQMRRDASVCPHCQRDSIAWILHRGVWWTKDAQDNEYYLDPVRSEWVRNERR